MYFLLTITLQHNMTISDRWVFKHTLHITGTQAWPFQTSVSSFFKEDRRNQSTKQRRASRYRALVIRKREEDMNKK